MKISHWCAASENGVIIYLPEPVEDAYPLFFQALFLHLQAKLPRAVTEYVPSYCSCLIEYAEQHTNEIALLAEITQFANDHQMNTTGGTGKHHIIPVCYTPEFGEDSASLCLKHQISLEQLIIFHSKPIYRVYSTGFIPGFAFLGFVDTRIQTPRHAQPRNKVAAGSVGIAGQQTGIYPAESPGGWQIIGRTPHTLYAPEKGLFSIFRTGDSLQFESISLSRFHDLANEQ